MFIVLLRTIILYLTVVLTLRLMGKRQIGELQPYELVISIMISELASLPMQDTRIPLIYGIIPIFTLLALQIIISVLQLKSEGARKWICGKPSILIMQGKLQLEQLKSQRVNVTDLFEELRLQGYYNVQNIEFAILETSGKLSVIPKTELEPVQKQDLNIQVTQEKLPIILISDGKIAKENLNVIHKDKSWLVKQLRKNNLNEEDIQRVFVAMLDSNEKFFFQLK